MLIVINASLITNLSCLNSGLNQNFDIIANKLNLSLNTYVCCVYNPMFNGDFLKM